MDSLTRKALLTALTAAAFASACGGSGSGDSAASGSTVVSGGGTSGSSTLAAADTAAQQTSAAPSAFSNVGPVPRPTIVDAALDEAKAISTQTFASGLVLPWGLDFLPDGRIIVTEKPGRMRLVDKDGVVSAPLSGVPAVTYAAQAGLLDVTVSPDFKDTQQIFFTFVTAGSGDEVQGAVASAKLNTTTLALEDVRVLWRQNAPADSATQFGMRVVVADDGTLLLTSGDHHLPELAQDMSSTQGKVIRINRDGSIPDDNPFVGRSDVLPEIYAFGFRNPQGGVLHPQTRKLWTSEHGAEGGDEINQINPGGNYGWELVSWGRNYDGTPVGTGQHQMTGVTDPVQYWTWEPETIAPSGITFSVGRKRPSWYGNLFVAGLKSKALRRLVIDENNIVQREIKLLTDLGERLRAVKEGPDGDLYVLTDNTAGRIIRVGL